MSNWVEEFFQLNPDAIKVEEKKGKEYKNDLFGVVLPALDRRDIHFFSKLNDEQKKDISIWTLTRWMSSTESAEQLITVNYIVNRKSKFFSTKKTENSLGTNKHKELQWMLLAVSGLNKRVKHVWPGAPRGIKKNLIEEFILKLNPSFNDEELDLFFKVNSEEELIQLLKDNSFDDKTIKELLDKGK